MDSAQALPRTTLSDHIEARLADILLDDRELRASQSGRSYEEVLGAEPLVVRVVSSVDQNLEEFGAEADSPNKFSVNIDYLDSVKHFTPDIRAANGIHLRTLVFQTILIGYLEFCKMRGFKRCFIWAEPPQSGTSYIFYNPPASERQHDLASIRDWNLDIFRRAKNERIVRSVECMIDFLFQTSDISLRAGRLPYYDNRFMESINALLETINANSNVSRARKDEMMRPLLAETFQYLKDNPFVIKLHPHRGDSVEEETFQNNIFCSREDFFRFCVENNCQFDTLESAQESTMKILQLLHYS